MLMQINKSFETKQGAKPTLPVVRTATLASAKDVRMCPVLNNLLATLSRTPFSPRGDVLSCLEYTIKPRRSKVWTNNPTKVNDDKNGFRHYDLVKASHRTRGTVVGSVRSLKATVLMLRTTYSDNFPVSYKKSVILQRFGGLVYTW